MSCFSCNSCVMCIYDFEFYKYEETPNCRLYIVICHVLGVKYAA